MISNLPTVFAQKRLSQQRNRRRFPLFNPSPYLYSPRGPGHGPAQSKVLREGFEKVFDNYNGGNLAGGPTVHVLSDQYSLHGKCPSCAGPMLAKNPDKLTKDDDRRSALPFCPTCRKQFTQSEFNWNQRGNLQYNRDFETVGVEKAWNQPLPSEAQFDMSKHSPDPFGNSSGVRQY